MEIHPAVWKSLPYANQAPVPIVMATIGFPLLWVTLLWAPRLRFFLFLSPVQVGGVGKPPAYQVGLTAATTGKWGAPHRGTQRVPDLPGHLPASLVQIWTLHTQARPTAVFFPRLA